MSIQPISTYESTTANREWLASLHGTDSVEGVVEDKEARPEAAGAGGAKKSPTRRGSHSATTAS
ncbi:hypothetical protein [Streptomyces sp. NPDC005435]|uniref:hypothetical protein n=1 Tax=Streptomyces sp. NPDC005435 TaxID=3154464 RepID=UPI0034555B52